MNTLKTTLFFTLFFLGHFHSSIAQCGTTSGTCGAMSIISLEVVPGPSGGTGTTADPVECTFIMNVCVQLDGFNEVALNWAHGVYIYNAPDGTLVEAGPTGAQPSSDGTVGNWIFVSQADIDANGYVTNGFQFLSPGFYFDLDNDGNPTNNLGDQGEGNGVEGAVPETFANLDPFCFKLTVDCTNNDDFTPGFGLSGDGETGSFDVFNPTCLTEGFLPSACGPNGNGSVSYIAGSGLPIHLASFRAETAKDANNLYWTTSSEVNAEWHIIERSANGKTNFEEIGRIKARGNQATVEHYSLSDDEPLNTSYYRLRTLDYNKLVHFSPLVFLKRTQPELDILTVHPNPTKESLTVEFVAEANTSVSIGLLDFTGKVIRTEQMISQETNNAYFLDLSNYAAGIYFIQINSDGKNSITQKIVKE